MYAKITYHLQCLKIVGSFTAAFLTWIQLQYSRARELFQKILVQLRLPWILHWIWTLANSWRSYNQSWQKLNNEWMRSITFPTVIGQLLSVRANIGSYYVANNSLRTWWQPSYTQIYHSTNSHCSDATISLRIVADLLWRFLSILQYSGFFSSVPLGNAVWWIDYPQIDVRLSLSGFPCGLN